MIVSEEAASLLREYVAGERGQKLRTQLASKHPNRSNEEIEEAVQTACKCFLEEAEGIEAPGQVYTWIRTAAHHALNREEEHRGWVDPVDPTGRDLAVAATQVRSEPRGRSASRTSGATPFISSSSKSQKPLN